MTTARNIITLALESMNKLSPGETLDADVAAVCLRRLNSIADDWSTGRDMMPQDQIVSGVVTGASFNVASGSFAAISRGDEIENINIDGYPTDPISMEQYNNIFLKTSAGRPTLWAWDGALTIYLWPTATANTINILTRVTFQNFADLDTAYILSSGYEGAFAATLAVAMAPALVGKVSQDLMMAKKTALYNVQNQSVRPAKINSNPLRRRASGGNIIQGW